MKAYKLTSINYMNMRAKVYVESVKLFNGGEELTFRAIAKSGTYPEDGSDEDNTYAKFSPSATFTIFVANPVLFGNFKPGEKYYVDFSAAESREAA